MARRKRVFALLWCGLFVTVGFALFAWNAAGATTVAGGNVTADTLWDATGSPYWVEGNVTVLPNVTLTIGSGVEVRFANDTGLWINGGMDANGSWGQPIVFQPNATSGRWLGITIDRQTNGTRLANVSIQKTYYVALIITAPTQPVAVSDLAVFNSTDGALYIAGAHGVSVINATISQTDNAISLSTSYNLTFASLRFLNLTNNGQYSSSGMYAYRVDDSAFSQFNFSSPGVATSQIEMAASNRVTFDDMRFWTDVSANQAMQLDHVTSARIANFTTFGYSRAFYAITSSNISLADANASWNKSGGMQVSFWFYECTGVRGSRLASTTGPVLVDLTQGILDNVSLFAANVLTGWSSNFVFDNFTMQGGWLFVDNGKSRGVVKNTHLSQGAAFYFEVPNGADNDFGGGVDLRENNTVDGVPVLAYFNQVNPPSLSAGSYAFLYAFRSSGFSIDGLNFTGGANCLVCVHNVSSFAADNLDLRLPYGRVWIYGGTDLRVSKSKLAANQTSGTAIEVWGARAVTLDNITASAAARGVFLFNVTGLTGRALRINATGAPAIDAFLVANFVLEDSQVNASVQNGRYAVILTQIATGAMRNVAVCAAPGGTGDVIISDTTDMLLSNVSLCPTDVALALSNVNRGILENCTFNGSRVGAYLTQSSSITIRRNQFANSTGVAVSLFGGSAAANRIYGNNFWPSTLLADDASWGVAAVWYEAVARTGNFWSNYTGPDANFDWVGDLPEPISGSSGREDVYPWLAPIGVPGPVARIFVVAVANEDAPVMLDGSNSTAASPPRTGIWNLTQAGLSVNETGVVANHTFAEIGRVAIRFRFSDEWNRTTFAFTNLTLLDITPPTLPITGVLTFDEDVIARISFNVTDNDPQFPIGANFSWVLTGGWASQNFLRYTNASKLNFTFGNPGWYTCWLNVTDAAHNSASLPFNVQVRDRTPPSFEFVGTVNASTFERETLTFEVRNATDRDPSFPGAAPFQWTAENASGPIASWSGASFSFFVPRPGNYTVRCTVVDPSGNSANRSYSFVARDGYGPDWAPPTGLQGTDRTPVNLSAAAATDPSGIGGATWSEGGLPIAEGISVTVLLPVPGAHTLQVEVRDTLGQGSNFTLVVMIIDTTPPQLSDPALNATGTVKQNADLRVDASAAFVDNDPLFPALAGYRWTTDAAGAAFVTATNGPSVVVQFPAIGSFNLSLEVSDRTGNRVTVVIAVLVVDGISPVGLLVSSVPSGTILNGTLVDFTSSASDPGGVTFAWDFGDGGVAAGPKAQHAFALPGNYTVRVEATDALGNSANQTLHIRVVAPPPYIPPGGGGTSNNTTIPGGGSSNNTTGPGGGGNQSRPSDNTPPGNPIGGMIPLVAAAGLAAVVAAVAVMVARRRRHGTAPVSPAAPPVSPTAKEVDAAETKSSQRQAYEALYGAPPPKGP